MMRKRGIYVLFVLSFVWAVQPRNAGAEEFFYQHQAGDRYRIISTVREDVYIDSKLSHQAEILNRITAEVVSEANGKSRHKAVFQTSERGIGSSAPGGTDLSFRWENEYDSEFERNRLGNITIDKKYFMPVVRNVPVFPGKDLKPGEKWTAAGHEMHDFRTSFGIQEPYRIPFTADYVFLGERVWKKKPYPAFSVQYKIDSRPQAVSGKVWPRRITGFSKQTVYWDKALGQSAAYEEEFSLIFNLSSGKTVEFRGTAEAEIVESHVMDKQKIVEEIKIEIERLHITDAAVKVVDEGITISMENIQFREDSAEIFPGEQGKIDMIAEILKRYPDRDIQVSGHTALAGTAAGRKRLSEERAAAVAQYLISKKVRSADRVVVRGFGADRPIADNNTDEGKRKNRRVEITILEN